MMYDKEKNRKIDNRREKIMEIRDSRRDRNKREEIERIREK